MSSFVADEITMDSLTFDNVLLIPAYSEVLPKEVQLKTKSSCHIEMNAPLVSAAMDTVTESAMTIAIAREGGVGVICKNMPTEEQAHRVAVVERVENGMIYDPATIRRGRTVQDALEMMRSYYIGGIPVVDEDGYLAGIVANCDLRSERRLDKAIDEVITHENLMTTHARTDLVTVAQILQEHKIEELPAADANNKLVGLIIYKDITKAKDESIVCKDEKGRLRVAAGVGIAADTMERLEALVVAGADAVVIDTAHGHSRSVTEKLREAKAAFPNIGIVMDNVVTAAATRSLVDNGAGAVKVGVGPDSICITHVVVDVGILQSSAIYDVSSALRDTDIPLIADGGLCYSGNMAKALAAGGSSMMMGSLVAGIEESPGETIIFNDHKFEGYRDMGNLEAVGQKSGSKGRYFQAGTADVEKLVPEGVVGRVPYKETVQEVICQLMGGPRSGMGHCDAAITEESYHAKFVHITNAGVSESHLHDISITNETLSYSRPG